MIDKNQNYVTQNIEDKIIEEIKNSFFYYLKVYLTNRDFNEVKKLFSPNFRGFGTGFDEVITDIDKAILLYKRDIEELPDPIQYEILSLHIDSPFNNIGIVWCKFNVRLSISKQEVKLNNLRLSMVWIKNNDKWYIEHMHISLPTAAHGEEEAYPIKEIEDRNKVLQKLVDEKTEELKQANLELEKIAVTDKLTGLNNRSNLEKFLISELERSTRYNRPFSIIMIDIDHFKETNDKFGHIVGDKVLQQFSKLIYENLRKSDICGRWGGEEFIIICPETDIDGAYLLADKLRKIIEKNDFNIVHFKTASFGVTSFNKNDNYETIIERVDKALYEAKNSGRNKVVKVE
ncbi:MAG: diguanylate cyclase [Spirochaetes bacterium]|nr:diguanylate cyclase [Spirochaetota bacterium]